LFVVSVAHATPASNPAFLGIDMQDFGSGCQIKEVTACSPAKDAGLRALDVIVAMDGKPIFDGGRRSTCDILRERILEKAPNENVSYNVNRNGERVVVNATLATRADVQHRCFVGRTLPSFDVTELDNPKHNYDLGELRGKTTVIGWVLLNRCSGCGAVFDAIADGMKRRLRNAEPAPLLLGLTPKPDAPNVLTRSGFSSTVAVATIALPDFEQLTLKENGERIQFMVVDCRGVIRFAAPLAPGSEDLDAAVDELLAAVEQAERLRTQRR